VCVCLQLLIEAKAGIEVRDKKDGITPLIGTFFHNHIDTARFLIEAGADIMMRRNDENGITPLVNAVALQRTEMANLICEKGALDINLSLHHYDVAGSIANVAASRRWCAGVQPKKTRTRLERSKRREEAIVHRRTRSACSCCMEFTFCIIRLPRYAARHCERASERARTIPCRCMHQLTHGPSHCHCRCASQQVEPQGIIVLDGAKAQVPPGAKKGEFVVTTSRRNYEIQAASVEERDQWIEAIEKNIAQYGVENPVSPSFNMEGKMPRLVGDDEDD